MSATAISACHRSALQSPRRTPCLPERRTRLRPASRGTGTGRMAHASRRLAVSRRLAITEGSGKRRLPPSRRRRPGHKAESAWRSRSARNPGRSQPGPQSRITRLPPSRRRRPGRKAESGLAKPIRTQPGPLATRAAKPDNSFTAEPKATAGPQSGIRLGEADPRASRAARNPGRKAG